MSDPADATPAAEQRAEGERHPPFLAHHFASHRQQFDAARLGMWIFLMTEILLFGGLFCAYAVYRSHHPFIFREGAAFLSTALGAANTCVLLLSSLTMAWGVRCAQLGQRKGLILCLVITLLCGGVFLGVKGVEYAHKIRDGLLWAGQYAPTEHAVEVEKEHAAKHDAEVPDFTAAFSAEQRQLARQRVGVFFSIYYLMTGLHGVHVIAGMIALAWILVRSIRGHFGRHYFGPVDFVGLYWHLVDLIWIYLFPLFYLID